MNTSTTLIMPKVQALAINTKGLPFLKRMWGWLGAKRKWVILEDFFIEYKDEVIKIPKGFVTDFASIPRIATPLLSPTGVMLIPALPHDFFYQYGCLLNEDNKRIFEYMPRKWGDKMFRDIGKEVNGMVTPNVISYVALDLFGWIAWNKYRKGK